MKVVSFYTVNTPYEQEAEKLRKSCNNVGIDIDILGVPNKGSWNANTKWKPFVILRALNLCNEDVCYVDADATFHDDTSSMFFEDYNFDMAAYIMDKEALGQDTRKRKFSLMSGTLIFRNNEKARDILVEWQSENELKPRKWDQHNLERVFDFDPQTGKHNRNACLGWLPVEMCTIDRTHTGVENPIIRHHQASRRLRKVIGS